VSIVTNEELVHVIERAVERAMERHPRPTQVNMKQAAEMLNVSPMTITRMVRAGKLKLNSCGLIPIGQIDAALDARYA
jgi:Mn-dependent DtxR family transcriptional regulator